MTSTLGWRVEVDSLVQVDGVPYAQASVDELDAATRAPLNTETIAVRRALLRVQAHQDGIFAALELEGSTSTTGPVARLLGAAVGWTLPGERASDPPLVTLATGLLLIPFGAEVPTNVRDKTFLEVPTWAQAFFPGNYDGGALARGGYGAVRWTIGIMDGAPSGDLQWKGRDTTSGYDVLGRLGGEVALPQLWGRPRFTLGVSALTGKGFTPGVAPTKDTIQWVDDNQNGIVDPSEIQPIAGTPGQPSQTFTHTALGADASARWCLQELGSGTAWGEIAAGTNMDRGVFYADPIDTKRDLRELGFSLGVLQDVTPWAQAGARYDRYDADRDAQEQAGTAVVRTNLTYTTLGLLVAARRGTAKLIVEYDHKRNPLGLSDSGLPATRGDDRLAVRAEVKF